MLTERRWHSNTVDIRSPRGADCDTDHCLLVAKVRERLAVTKQETQRFELERFNLRKLSELEVREQYQIKISKRFAALEDLNNSEDINRAWENIKENINASAKHNLGLHELKQHERWFDEECSRFLDHRQLAKLQWIQDPNQSNVDNPNNVRHKASRHFRNKKKEYLKAKSDELETNSKTKHIRDLHRGISYFKKVYESRINIVRDEKGELFTDSHSILAR
jgi:hypothetical protein